MMQVLLFFRCMALFGAILAMSVSPPMARAEQPGAWIDVEIEGAGPPVILIPGLSSSADVWEQTTAALKGDYTVHIVQVKGFANTPAAPGMESQGLLAGLTAQLADYIGTHALDRPAIIGHSMGGYLALRLSRDHPNLIGKAVIVDALPFYSVILNPAATEQSMQGMAAGFRAQVIAGAAMDPDVSRPQQRQMLASMVSGDADLDMATSWAMQSNASVVGQAVYELMLSDLRSDLAGLKTATLVLAAWAPGGPFNEAQTQAFWQAQYAAHSAAEVEIISPARHFIMLDQPGSFNARIAAYLADGH